MLTRFTHIVLPAVAVCLFFSCRNMPSKNHGPIVLGDSSTIVTENDPQKLKDLVNDLQPVIPPSENKDTAEAPPKPAKDTLVKNVPPPPVAPNPTNEAGLRAEFRDVTVLIPGLKAKQAGRQNLQNASGAVYTLENGNINGNTLKLSGNITKVSQRYQSVVMLKNEMGQLLVDQLSVTTDWEQIKGSNNQYAITDLDQRSLEYPHVSANAIRSAVSRAAKRRRMSRRRVNEWANSVRRARAVNQKPFTVMLRSVMWKIDGKDAKGKNFSKQVRIDLPL